MKDPGSILITGASSGIGGALALAYAAPGVVLVLGGRNQSRLEAVATACRERGATVETRQIDVTDADAMAAWIAKADAAARLDLVIANAGISGGSFSAHGGADSGTDQTRQIFAVNVDGVINTVLPAIQVLRARAEAQPATGAKRAIPKPTIQGQIAIMSSLAGYRGMPGAAAYSASKAAVKVLGEGLRGALRHDGIEVSVICPGFIKTPMTDANPFPMPFIIGPERAAAIIKRGLDKGKARIAFPFPANFLTWLATALPPGLIDPMLRRLPDKH
ncbi:MAG: SDR family NAD(P)-dependent oxidoreductase [Alphaproteobacteria bacterium]